MTTRFATSLYVREDLWGMKKYPRQCDIELRLIVADDEAVLLPTLLVRANRCDLTTFEHVINAGEPSGVRILQHLGRQEWIDFCIASEMEARSFRLKNGLAALAARTVDQIRARSAWSAEQFEAARTRMMTLYPTAHALWWGRTEGATR